MHTPMSVVQSLPDDELRRATGEALMWSSTGRLEGDVLQGVADQLVREAGLVDDDALRQADTLVCREAARRFAGMADTVSIVAKWLAFTAPEVHDAFLREFKR